MCRDFYGFSSWELDKTQSIQPNFLQLGYKTFCTLSIRYLIMMIFPSLISLLLTYSFIPFIEQSILLPCTSAQFCGCSIFSSLNL